MTEREGQRKGGEREQAREGKRKKGKREWVKGKGDGEGERERGEGGIKSLSRVFNSLCVCCWWIFGLFCCLLLPESSVNLFPVFGRNSERFFNVFFSFPFYTHVK